MLKDLGDKYVVVCDFNGRVGDLKVCYLRVVDFFNISFGVMVMPGLIYAICSVFV